MALSFAAVSATVLALALAGGWWSWSSARSELRAVQLALESEELSASHLPADRAAATRDRDAALARLQVAQRDRELEARRLAARTPAPAKQNVIASNEHALRQAAAVTRTVSAMLVAGEATANAGDPEAQSAFVDALHETSRMLQHQESNRGGALQPELDLLVGNLLRLHGPIGDAAPHLARAVASGAGILTTEQMADAAIGAAEVRLWTGEPARADATLNGIAALEGERSSKQAVAIARVRALSAAMGHNRTRTRSAMREWHRLAAARTEQDPAMLHAASLELGNALRNADAAEEADRVVRAQLAQDETRADPTAALESRALLAWILIGRGHMAEGPALERKVLESLDAQDPPELGACSTLVVEFLVSRNHWPAAVKMLEARWKQTRGSEVSPTDRKAIARDLKRAYSAIGQAELAAAWQQTIEHLNTAATPAGTPNAAR
ncbi:MAG: hypothetical protein JNK53_05160 [Phycisphaerae bacterium]|nr:hypothetical protein [Phycisphaerae bacterium]